MQILESFDFVFWRRYVTLYSPHLTRLNKFRRKDTPNRYRVKQSKVSFAVEPILPEFVQFTPCSGLHQLPSPELLRLHAAIAHVLNASGLGRLIDEVVEDRELIRVLAQDGSTSISKLLLGVAA